MKKVMFIVSMLIVVLTLGSCKGNLKSQEEIKLEDTSTTVSNDPEMTIEELTMFLDMVMQTVTEQAARIRELESVAVEFFDYSIYCASEYQLILGLDIFHISDSYVGGYKLIYEADGLEYFRVNKITGTIFYKLIDDNEIFNISNRNCFKFVKKITE